MNRIALLLVAFGAGFAFGFENPGWDYRVRNLYIPAGGYFNTGFTPTSAPKVTIRCAVYGKTACDVFGTEQRQAGCFILNCANNRFYYRYGKSDHAGAWGSYEVNVPLDLVCDTAVTCYGTTAGTLTAEQIGSLAENTSPVTVPGREYLQTLDLHYFKAEQGGEVACELIPCVKGGVPQLYDTVAKTFVAMSGTGTPVAGARVADDGSDADKRGIVTTLPAPDADGCYVFGDESYSKEAEWNDPFFTSMVYPKWSAMNLPAKAKIKLVGGVALGSGLPADATLDLTGLKGLYQCSADAFGTCSVTIPAGCYWWPAVRTVTETNSVLVMTGSGYSTITNDVAINGTLRQSDRTGAYIYLTGRVTGSGRIESNNFGKHIYFSGSAFSFTGDNAFNSNYGGSINVRAPAGQTKWKKFYASGTDATWELRGYYGARLVYDPPKDCNEPMSFTELSGDARVFWVDGKLIRTRGAVCCWGGRILRADKLTGRLHFLADSSHNRAVRDGATSGYGNLEVGTVDGATAFLSTNFNAVVATASGKASFDYTGDSNAVNTATLRVTNSCASTVTVKATDVVALPAVMKGLHAASKVYLVETVENETHAMPLDFAAEVVNPAGCDGSGTLAQAPAAATLAVTFPTGRTAPVPPSGRVPLATFDAGGAKLAGWTVTLNGSAASTALCRGKVLTVMRDDTGLWIKVHQAGAIMVVR